MCYAIPGNVKSITEDLITVYYFGEKSIHKHNK